MKSPSIKIRSRFSDEEREITPAVWEHMQLSGRSLRWYVVPQDEKPSEIAFESEEKFEIKPIATPTAAKDEPKPKKTTKKQSKQDEAN